MKSHDDHAAPAGRQFTAVQREQAQASDSAIRTQAPQSALQSFIDSSPRVLTQRKAVEAAFGIAVQRMADLPDIVETLEARDGPTNAASIQAPTNVSSGQTMSESLLAAPIKASLNRTGMPSQLKAGIESLSGMDLSDVRVHYNSDKPMQLNAHAYAHGNDIHLSPGQEQFLPHEAWHVVQQRQGRVGETTRVADVGVNDEQDLESEADLMGGRAILQGMGMQVPEKSGELSLESFPHIVTQRAVLQRGGGPSKDADSTGEHSAADQEEEAQAEDRAAHAEAQHAAEERQLAQNAGDDERVSHYLGPVADGTQPFVELGLSQFGEQRKADQEKHEASAVEHERLAAEHAAHAASLRK
jgi:hypothetical protein